MAQIRLVDLWLRSPAAHPTAYRSVMVLAEKWAEQRVLMRAYAQSRDQTMPTILLRGFELAIGLASVDVNGPWGIHVGDGPATIEQRAHTVKLGLEDAARRLAGSKGNPPRLADEESSFEREPTGNWAPGTPRVLPRETQRGSFNPSPPLQVVTTPGAARVSQAQAATIVINQPATQLAQGTAPQAGAVAAPSNPELRKTPVRRHAARTKPPSSGGRTALGYSSGAGAQSAIVRLGLTPHVSAHLGRLADREVPTDFHLEASERRVLNAICEADDVSAHAIGALISVADAVSFMEDLQKKLEIYGLGDLVEPGEPSGGEPTYRMKR
ncbi:hypothetical protein BH11MYX1_BH11MYX1_42040 [soil metagenome]